MSNNAVCDFGKWAGLPYTQIPVSYLNWMMNVSHSRADLAQAELERRGSTIPDMEITPHAINRASQRVLDIWLAIRIPENTETGAAAEGLHAWLLRLAGEARTMGEIDKRGRYHWCGVIFAFEKSETAWPVLATVMRDSGNGRP